MDYYGNGITSNFFTGSKNALDVETVFGGSIVDPRARTWTLLNSTDSVNSVQSGAWTTGRTWTISSSTDSIASVQSGTWTTGRTWTLLNSTDSVNSVQSGTWTMQQGGTPTTAANAWPVKPTDGTNIITVKAASTAPLATDTAQVVVLSPNGDQATAALQTTGNTTLTAINTAQSSGAQKSQTVDASGNVITVKISNTLPVITDTAIVTTERPDNTGTVTETSISCAATSTTLLAAATATNFLAIRNPTTATATVWIRFDGSAATAAAPSVDLPPGGEADFFASGTSFLPSSQFNCISGGTSSTLTLFYK